MENYLISVSPFGGGLSCRIDCLVSSIKIAEKTGRKLILYWPKNPPCNCHFSDLFANYIKEIQRKDLEKIIKSRNYDIYRENLNGFDNKKKFIFISSSRLIGFSKENLQLKFEKIPKTFREDISNYIKKLKIRQDILKIVNNFSKKTFSKNVVGIHIRKGDFKTIKNNVGAVSADEKYMEEINRIIQKDKNIKFFLATEDKETEKKFKAIYGNKMITYNKITRYREEEGAVEEALIELILLSKCKLILGNFGSTFTEMAWFLGECKPEMKIIIEKNALKKHIKLETNGKSLFNKIKQITYNVITPSHIKLLGKA